MTKEKKYISIPRLRILQENIGFIDNYLPNDDEVHHVGDDLETIDVENTNLLYELGQLNRRRNEIIDKLMGK